MIKKLTFIITSTLALMVVAMSPLALQTVHAGGNPNKDAACEGVRMTGGGGCDADASGTINNVIRTVIDLFSIVVGVTAVIMIMVGGFKYIVSSGDSSNVNSAKNTILYAIVGLVIVVLAQVIVRFVLGRI